MDALEALTTRVSPKELGEPAPGDATLGTIFAAALRAPDHGRLRPWRFILIRGEGRERLGELFAASLLRREPQASSELLERERGKAFRAPLVIVVAAHFTPAAKVPDVEQLLSAATAAQNIMIACHALGFAAMWKTGEPAYDPAVKEALGLTAGDGIAGFINIGTPKGVLKQPAPLNQADFVRRWPAD
jgi:nitroreductase